MKQGYRLDPKILKSLGIPEPAYEYKFHPTRRWRIDICWPNEKLAVEIEGGIWSHGRHVRGAGFLKDIEKYNSLTLRGYALLRFSPKEIKDYSALGRIKEYFDSRR